MTVDTIREILHDARPFTLRMVSGRVLEVPHTDFAMLSRSATSLIITGERDKVEIIRFNQVESIETHEGAANA